MSEQFLSGDPLDSYIGLNQVTIERLLSSPCRVDAMILYVFYCYRAKFKKSKVIWSNSAFTQQGTMLTKMRFLKAKKELIFLGLIEDIQTRKEDGTLGKPCISVNYISTSGRVNQWVDLPPGGESDHNKIRTNNELNKENTNKQIQKIGGNLKNEEALFNLAAEEEESEANDEPPGSAPPPLKKAAIKFSDPVKRVSLTIMSKWNSMKCVESGLVPKILGIKGNREKLLKAAISSNEDFESTFDKLIERIERSDFLKGKSNGERKWNVDVDWILNPANAIKVLEGRYENKEAPRRASNNQRTQMPW